VDAIPSARGAGSTWRVGSRSIREVVFFVDPSARCRCARRLLCARVEGFGGTRRAVLALRGACETRPAQGRVGIHARHDSNRSSAHHLLSALATVHARGARPRSATVRATMFGRTQAVARNVSRRLAFASTELAHRPARPVAHCDRSRHPVDAPRGQRGSFARTPADGPERAMPRGKGVDAA
jgi:hypothetical protein